MSKEKRIKKELITEASKHPEKYFPVETLKDMGFRRYKCSKCGRYFWSTKERKICGDTNCIGGYKFINDTPAERKLEFNEVYKEFRKFMEKRGYKHIERFPIVARWRDDLDFNIASIIGFQPFVTKGIVPPPAKIGILAQNCLRFGDIDNVGYSGRHGTNFVMIGQVAFTPPNEYDQSKYVKDLINWFVKGMEIPLDEIQIHEDAWLGGGDCGPSMEFFSRGLELANQVYMWFDMSDASSIKDLKELNLKVLDMGMGLERCCWFSKGSLNQYEANMPLVCNYLFEKTNLKPNWDLYHKFLPYSGLLNLDEVEDIDEVWKDISNKIGIDYKQLRETVEPLAGIYSIADHSRTLLYALTDGALPSNVKGGYNLRLVLRRALDFIYKFNWDINLFDVIALQAEEVKGLYPEVVEELEGIKKIIEFEEEKYKEHKIKSQNKIQNIVKKDKKLTEEDFVKLYISDGITPNEIEQEFKKVNIDIKVPSNFFNLVSNYFEKDKVKSKKEKKDLFYDYVKDLKPTEKVFYEDPDLAELKDFKVLKEFEINNKKYLVLDKTIFYPEMGGQINDVGYIGNYKIKNVFNIEGVIVHEVE